MIHEDSAFEWCKELPEKCRAIFGKFCSYFDFTPSFAKGFFASELELCQSPIEKIFCMEVLCLMEILKQDDRDHDYAFALEPQSSIEVNGHSYRPDFKLSFVSYITLKEHTIYIDCDGHRFHEKTKEQVKYSNNRDYDFKISGEDLLHFSGSQIYNNCGKCALDAIRFLLKKGGID